ncbi:MAG: ABC transporter permease [Bdellovibrionales bacterium]
MKKLSRSQILFLIGLGIILLTLAVAIFAPWIAPQDPELMSLKDNLQGPSFAHPLGLDENGSDVMAKLVYGARVSLGVAWSVILISGVVGLIVGSSAGYFGGWLEQVLMRIVDMVYAFPGFLLALALVAVLGPSLKNLIIALCLTSWTGFARLVRGEVLHLKERDYVQSARAMGASHLRILVLHIWPNLLGLLIVQSTFAMAGTIISESGLSFLGLGVPASTPTWGSLLNSGRRVLIDAPHVSFSAGIAIMTVVLGFNLLGDGLRDILDPRRGRNRI